MLPHPLPGIDKIKSPCHGGIDAYLTKCISRAGRGKPPLFFWHVASSICRIESVYSSFYFIIFTLIIPSMVYVHRFIPAYATS